MAKKYTLTEIKPGIFFLNFKNRYDLCMHFLRYQEYYESPKFRNKAFELIEYMEWYSKAYGKGAFTYANDWAGFNIPRTALEGVFKQFGLTIHDWNKYDTAMFDVWKKCSTLYPTAPFYLIGVANSNYRVMKHEIAHGLFYTNPEYEEKMTALVKKLDPAFRKELYTVLKKRGYASNVLLDESQAFLSTGMLSDFKRESKEQEKEFIKVFKRFQ